MRLIRVIFCWSVVLCSVFGFETGQDPVGDGGIFYAAAETKVIDLSDIPLPPAASLTSRWALEDEGFLKSSLAETPWQRDLESVAERRVRLARLFQPERLRSEGKKTLETLHERRRPIAVIPTPA